MSRNAYQAAGNVAGQFSGNAQLGSVLNLNYLVNLIENGDFDTTTGWTPQYGTGAVVDGEYEYTITSVSSSTRIQRVISETIIGHKYYVYGRFKPKYNEQGASLRFQVGSNSASFSWSGIVSNEWNRLSAIITPTSTGTVFYFYVPTNAGTPNYIVGDKIYFDKIGLIDLTESFGEGHEPTVEQMDSLMKNFMYEFFDGTTDRVNNKDNIFPNVITSPTQISRSSKMPLDTIGNLMYLRNGDYDQILKSTDGWANTSVWYDLLTDGFTLKLSDEILIAISDTKVLAPLQDAVTPANNGWYIIEDLGGSFRVEKQTDLVMEIGYPSNTFGCTKYPENSNASIILITEYGAKTAGAYARQVHCSIDGGETFRVIFQLPEVVAGSTHTHSARYDNYEDRVYVVSGDAVAATNIWYSDDWRNETPTWNTIFTQGEATTQATSICIDNNFVLFGSDGVGINGIYAMSRTDLTPFPAYVIDPRTGTIFVGRYFRKSTSGRYYITFTDNNNDGGTRHGCLILASYDGKLWHEVFRGDLDAAHDWNKMWLYGDKLIWYDGSYYYREQITWTRT